MRWVCGAVVPCRVGLPTVGTLRRYHPSGRNGAAAQMGRSGDTMVCGLTCVLHTGAGQCFSGRFSDTMRWVYGAVACRDWLPRLGRFGDTIRRGGLGQLHRWAHRRHHGLWVGLHTGAGQCRSGRSAIPCGGCASRSWSISDWVATVGTLRRYLPSGSVCTRWLGLQGASGVRLFTFGHQWV